MRIEICIENENKEFFEHEGYYDSIDEAINELYKLRTIWIKQKSKENGTLQCEKCVNYPYPCFGGKSCPNGYKYQRDPPDGGYYG